MKRSIFFRAMRRVPIRPRAFIMLLVMLVLGWVPFAVAIFEASAEAIRTVRVNSAELYGDFSKSFHDCWNALITGRPQ